MECQYYVDSLEDYRANGWNIERERQFYIDVNATMSRMNREALAQKMNNEAFRAGNCITIKVK